MKIRVTAPFYDDDGLHTPGEILDRAETEICLDRMEIIGDKIETAVKKERTKKAIKR